MKLTRSAKNSINNDKEGGKTMFLGLSLTTWLMIVGIFVIMTPIVGKQVAKDALKIKNSLNLNDDNKKLAFVLFPLEAIAEDKTVYSNAPIQQLDDEVYIFRMMIGGVWTKFLGNVVSMLVILLLIVNASICYLITTFFRGIFSTK